MDKEKGLSLPRDLVEFILLGPADDHRQLQDSPMLGDVWFEFAEAPRIPQDLLITPNFEVPAGNVARTIAQRLIRIAEAPNKPNIAYLQGIVAASLTFRQVIRVLVPLTMWWYEKEKPGETEVARKPKKSTPKKKESEELTAPVLKQRVKALLDGVFKQPGAVPNGPTYIDSLCRTLALAGLISWAGSDTAPEIVETNDEKYKAAVRDEIRRSTDEIAREAGTLLGYIRSWRKKGKDPDEKYKMIFSISLNRHAHPAIVRSIPSVKGDAARTLFRVDCSPITWAVIDSGIYTEHEAFKDEKGKPRVKKTLDFTRVREILGVEFENGAAEPERLKQLTAGTALARSPQKASEILKQLRDDADRGLSRDWSLIEQFIELPKPPNPVSIHGTHVAGIIGARETRASTESGYGEGMCPEIRFYDCRVIGKTEADTEFAVIGALQYIRYLNELHNSIMIHGANLSLSIPHNVYNFACGRTPICNECERLIECGVTVVAAAGNLGYHRFETAKGSYEGYAAFSITDPGNAESVITVGSTHRFWPHTYGVSFFSSRGPTGDGRMKPDLVAPGERIRSTIRPGEWGFESGTSMAAPHVSGAAAMLMARYPELIGQPRQIKQILCGSATDLGRERSFQGNGMLDVLRAMQAI